MRVRAHTYVTVQITDQIINMKVDKHNDKKTKRNHECDTNGRMYNYNKLKSTMITKTWTYANISKYVVTYTRRAILLYAHKSSTPQTKEYALGVI